jgi:outer membrane protein OmpA-like peptidoglycan-associated protein
MTRGLVAIVFGLGLSCDPATTTPSTAGCRYHGWTGQCVLTDIRTTRMIQRPPQTFVVVEGTYEPRGGPGEFVPPPFKKESFAAAAYERLLTEHLATYRTVQCSVYEPGADPCAPRMTANVPEFLPPRPESASAGPQGCAKLERMESSAMATAPVALPGPFQFDAGTAEITAESRTLAAQAAGIILADPKIECVAIKGKTAPGEDFALANERSQAVKRLLQGSGIANTRLTVFEATAPTYTAAPTSDQPVASEQRRVFLTVVLYKTGTGP